MATTPAESPRPGRPLDDGTERSAREELDDVVLRMYRRHHLATLTSGLVRSLGHPGSAVLPGANAAALAAAGAHVWWLHRAVDPASAAQDSTAWIDAMAGAATTAVGIPALDVDTWTRGTSWTNAHTLWCATGASVMGSEVTRPARWALVASTTVLPGSARRKISHLLPGIGLGFVGFATIGVLLRRRLGRTAARIDDAVDQLIARETEMGRRREETAIRQFVLARTAQRLREVQELLRAGDRAAAAEVADAEHERLRDWLSESRPNADDAPDGGAGDDEDLGAERQVAHSIHLLESAFRVAVTSAMAVEVLRGWIAGGQDRRERLVAALGIGHLIASVAVLLRSEEPDRVRLFLGDLAMLTTTAVAEVAARDRRPQWSLGYSIGLSVSAGMVGSVEAGPRRPELATALVRVLAGLATAGPAGVRVARAVDEAILMADASTTARWTVNLARSQARKVAATAASAARLRAALAAESVRQDRQYFVHDSAVQVLLWVSKPDLRDDQLLEWIDREVPAIEAAAAGILEHPPMDLQRELGDLVAGFELLDLRTEMCIEDPVALQDLTDEQAACVVDVLNECLTNAFKHGSDRRAAVHLVGGSPIVLTVTNAAIDSAPVSEGGTGLRAMHRRVAGVGGRLRSGRQGTSWVTRCEIRTGRSAPRSEP